MCYLCDGHTEAELHQSIKDAVRGHGWHLQVVTGGPDANWHRGAPETWAYTIGLLERFMSPELVVLGLDPPAAWTLLESIARLVAGGMNTEGAAWRHQCQLVPVHPDHLSSGLVAVWSWYYGAKALAGDFFQLIPPMPKASGSTVMTLSGSAKNCVRHTGLTPGQLERGSVR
jgi:hypothetical protein